MADKNTPHLKTDEQQTILTGSDFLTGREAQLQGRLDELQAELAGLGEVPGDVESLERQALDALRTLSDLLEPPASSPAPTTLPMPTPPLPSIVRAEHQRRPWRVAGIVAVLVVAALAAAFLIWTYARDAVGGNSPATAVVRVVATQSFVPTAPTRTTNSARPSATAAPILPAATAAPRSERPHVEPPARIGDIVQAEVVQVLDVSGTLRVELSLSIMADTIQVSEGVPVLQPVLPASGAGLYRGSAPFGVTGGVIVAVPAGSVLESLWLTRPGDRLLGCNSDHTCHDYHVIAAETWLLDRLHQLLRSTPAPSGAERAASYAVSDWRPGDEVLLYTAFDETSAWVIRAHPLQGEGTR